MLDREPARTFGPLVNCRGIRNQRSARVSTTGRIVNSRYKPPVAASGAPSAAVLAGGAGRGWIIAQIKLLDTRVAFSALRFL
jgi:hypothetical protein